MVDIVDDRQGYNTAYDSRIKTTDTIGEYMISIARAQLRSDWSAWLRLLRGLYSLTASFVRDPKAIDEGFIKSERTLDLALSKGYSKQNIVLVKSLDKNMTQLTTDLYKGIRHVLLPVGKDDEGTDIDEKSFLGGMQ